MIGDFDDIQMGFGQDKKLVEELAIFNILKMIENPVFNDVIDADDLKIIKDYLKKYIKESTEVMKKRLIQ